MPILCNPFQVPSQTAPPKLIKHQCPKRLILRIGQRRPRNQQHPMHMQVHKLGDF
jgi:hypothetical protein